MARELQSAFGDEWFGRHELFDDETASMIADAWIQGRLASLKAGPEVVHGKLVASFMLGFWVKLLGRGSVVGKTPVQAKRVYDDLLWKPALRKAFPNVGDLERARVASSAGDLKLVRNRIAHHEHVIWGVPAFGQIVDGKVRRIGVREAAAVCTTLAAFIDGELETWLSKNSQVARAVAGCPVNPDGLLLG